MNEIWRTIEAGKVFTKPVVMDVLRVLHVLEIMVVVDIIKKKR